MFWQIFVKNCRSVAEPVKKYYQPYLQKFVVLSVRKPLLSRKQKNSLWKQFPLIYTVNIFFITDKQLLHSWSSQHARGKSKIRLNYCSSLQYLKRSHLFYLWRFFFIHPKHVEEENEQKCDTCAMKQKKKCSTRQFVKHFYVLHLLTVTWKKQKRMQE